jgi:hypothetical protein
MNSATIIPATPGYEVLMALIGYLDEFVVCRNPIVAWQINPDEETCGVITLTSRYDTVDECTILCPDGKLLDSGENYHRATYAEWEAEKKREWNETRAKYGAPEAAEVRPNFVITGVSTRLKSRKETEMSEQGYNKASALERIGMIRAELSRLYLLVEDLPEVLSAKEGTDMDAFDCSRMADDISDRCKEIGLALGFEVITPEYFRDSTLAKKATTGVAQEE